MALGRGFVQIVARVSSRVSRGTELGHHKEWVDATINFAVDGFVGAHRIKKYPTFIRPLAAYWIHELSISIQHQATANRAIVPVLKGRGDLDSKPKDFLQWALDKAQGEETEKEIITSIQLKLSFATIYTSTAAPTQILYNLCARLEHFVSLR